MENVYKIIKLLEETPGTNDKIEVLRKNDSELLRKVLKYTYDKNMKYGISIPILEKLLPDERIGYCDYGNIFMLLDVLSASSINNSLRRQISLFLNENKDFEELYKRILLKDLQIGMGTKNINKAISGLLVDFAVMKAMSYDEKMESFNEKAEKEGYIKMIKKNGIRGEIFKTDNKVVIKTRQNKIVKGLIDIEKAFESMPNGFYEGEFLAIGEFKTSADQFKLTDSIHSSIGNRGGLFIELFDYISTESFNVGFDKTKCIDRKNKLKGFIEENNNDLIKYAEPIYIGKDTSTIFKTLEEVIKDNKEEGLMIALCNSPYKASKVAHILKVKEFYSMDLIVTSIVEGLKPATKGKMGSAIVDFKGNSVGVGGGWSKNEREYYFNNPNELIGKVLEVKYKEITKDKNGIESLQFPVKIRIRESGKEISYS